MIVVMPETMSVERRQLLNPANPAAHRTHTGPEFYEDTEGEVDIFLLLYLQSK